MRWCKLLLFFILLTGLGLPKADAMVLTQDEYLYRVWSVDAGLPQISVTAIVQDAEGFLWLGTQNGLARFDGVQFEVFNTANTAAMSSNMVSALHLDNQRQLWIGTANGLIMYHKNQFRRLDAAKPLQGQITGFAELSDGRIFVGGNRLYQWTQQELQVVEAHQGPVFQLFQHNDRVYIGGQGGFAELTQNGYLWQSAPKDLAGLQILEIAFVDGQLYLGTNIGLYRWHNSVWQPVTLPQHVGDSRIESLYLDQQQHLWISTYGSTYRIQRGVIERADFVKGEHNDFVWVESMLQDKHKNIWFGSRSHGLKRLRKAATQRFSLQQGLQDSYVWALAPWQQHLLVGTRNGLALLQHGVFQPLMANQYLPSPFVYSLLVEDDKVWVGSRAGLSMLDTETLSWRRNYDQIAHVLVTTLARENDKLWVGTNGGLYYLLHDEIVQHGLPEALLTARVRMVLPDSENRLWVGTENGLYLRDENGFHSVDDVPLTGTFISAIKQFDDGNLLIGSFDQGFMFGKPGQWQWFRQQDGLPGNGVIHVEQVDNQLVISNFQGFYRLNYEALKQNKIEELYMLVDDRRPEAKTDSHRCCNGAGSSKGVQHQGRLWYPTLDGVVSLPLQQLIHFSDIPEPVIKKVTAGSQSYRGDNITLPPEQRDLQVSFTAPYYVQASSVQMRYRLEGYDEAWIDASNRREAFYTNLPSGQYRFLLQVRVAGDFRWSDTAEMALKLTPFWHEKIWARGLFLILFSLVLWGLYRWRLMALAASQKQLAKLVAERTEELHLANEKLQQISMQDALTGLHNRHYLDCNIQQILSRANRHSEPLIWAVLDLDHFKQVNDNFGHQTGDNILMLVADILRQNSRGSDHIIRWGGEEFLLILEHTDDGLLALQRIHQALGEYPWQNKIALDKPLTCSIGAIAQLSDWDWQHSLRLADQALYWVKGHGRNGYMLLQTSDPIDTAVLAEDANVIQLLAAGKLSGISNKEVTAVSC